VNIQYIKIKNFKIFEDKEFFFHPQMNVIIGNNATGKTSVLEALSYSLGTFFLGLKGVDLRALKNREKRKKIISSDNSEIQLPFRIDVKHTLDNNSYQWYRSTNKEKGGATSYKNAKNMINKAKELDEKVRNGENVTLPLISYYGTDRVNDRNQQIKDRKSDSRFDGYYGALNQEVVRKQFLTWFRDYEDSVLKFNKDKALYIAFTNALTSMVKDWNKVHFSWKSNDMLGQGDDGLWTSFSMLSAGYKNIVRITADIAYRAIKLNPHLGENAVKETEGVVLIDEIDMHLHPKWQRTILTDLKNTFPKIQFIVTTHSPFVVQSLMSSDELILLDGEPLGEYKNLGIEEISKNMGVEHPEVSKEYETMKEVAKSFLQILDEAEKSPEEKQEEYKHRLAELIEPYAKNPAYQAFLELKYAVKLGE